MSQHPEVIRVGSTAVVRQDDGSQDTYVVVAPDRANPRSGLVSATSPIGRALLGRRVGESVIVPAPGGSFTLTIEGVAFEG